MATITLAPTDNWQAALRDHDGYGSVYFQSGQRYTGNGGIVFKAKRMDLRTTEAAPAIVDGYWVPENTKLAVKNFDLIPAPGQKLFAADTGKLDLTDVQVVMPPTHPQIKTLMSVNFAGFSMQALTRDILFDVGDRVTTQVFDTDTCGFKFSASGAFRIITKIDGSAICMTFDASHGKASGLHFLGTGRRGAGIEARRQSRITLSGDIRAAGLDIGMRAHHDSTIWLDSGTVEDCYQGLREEGGKIFARSAVAFIDNAADRIAIPVT